MTRWFTSDTHFFHAKMLVLQPRNFSSVEDMNETLVERWNEVVQPGDMVYHLGDFALSRAQDKEAIKSLFGRLKGNKFLIHGNHDLKNNVVLNLPWSWQGDLKTFNIDGQLVVCCHYAMLVWDQSHRGSWHVYGHSHGSLPEDIHALRMDVGVDAHDYRPVSFEEVSQRMSTKIFVPLDHHIEEEK